MDGMTQNRTPRQTTTAQELTELLIEVEVQPSPRWDETHIVLLMAAAACELGAIAYFLLWGLWPGPFAR